MVHTHQTAPTQFVEANGIRFAYRRFGKAGGVPLVFMQHFRGGMDHWDPTVTDGFAEHRPIILFDNAGVAASTGETPDTIDAMADHAADFIGALGLAQIDLLGFSIGAYIAQTLVRETPWDRLHLTYFLGYALWNYLTAPFLFARTGFATRELEAHVEGRETWRVLEVTYRDDVPAHAKVQKLYFGDDFMLRRLDYVTDVLGDVAAHYCYDQVTIDGFVFPTLRRVVRRTPEGPVLSGRTSFILDYTNLVVRK